MKRLLFVIAILTAASWAQNTIPAPDIVGAIQAGQNARIAASRPRRAAAAHKLMIFGGENHKTYLGCLNCSKFATDSVLNQFGDYGSKFAENSIFNQFGNFGSKFSNDSPCNQFATDPPVVVDENGGYYGKLTVSTTNPDHTRSQVLQAWITGVCSDH